MTTSSASPLSSASPNNQWEMTKQKAKKVYGKIDYAIRGLAIGIIYALATSISPLHAVPLMTFNGVALSLISPTTEKMNSSPLRILAVKIGSMMAVQGLFKIAYSAFNMFTSLTGTLFYVGITSCIVGINLIEHRQAQSKRRRQSTKPGDIELKDL